MDATPILFVPLIAATWMFGLALFSYISHIFLTIVEDTGNGSDQPVMREYRTFKSYVNDGFGWSEDVYTDWLWKFFYLAYIAGIWFAPSVMIGRAVSDDPWWRVAVAAILFWLSFPFGVTSSLASSSRWNPFWLPLVRLMVHRPVATFAFYLFTLPLVALMGTTFNLLFVNASKLAFMWVLLLSPVTTVAFFLYARLLGRYAFVLNCARSELYKEPEPEPERKPRKRKPKPAPEPDRMTQWSNPTEEHDQHPVNAQPADLPPIVTPDDEALTGYNVDFSGAPVVEEAPKPRGKVHTFDGEEDASPIPLNAEDDRNEPTVPRSALRRMLEAPPEREIALYMKHRQSEPDNPYGVDLVVRMLNSQTIAVGIVMTIGLAIFACLHRALEGLRPPV
ncbi:hypothetical protein [Zavarzinella formosa]|uniref:hypothetical protein n=1 Tax=Zavarzinella formosa TaxID=360055 RepID=UPI0003146D7A|nr:hypothetical protein [Zavarzinella formosa]